MNRSQFLQSILDKESWTGDRWRYDNAGRRIVYSWYDAAVFSGRILPIEYLEVDRKMEYWDAALTAGRDKKTSIEIAKVIYYLHIQYESQEDRRQPENAS